MFVLPQLLLFIIVIYKFINIDLSLCLLLITLIFVTYNKVVTAQYFTWYMCLMPTSLSSMSLKKPGHMLLCWVLFCLMWLYTAYYLEFRGRNSSVLDVELMSDVYSTVWITSILFHVMNVICIAYIVKSINI